MIKRIHESAAGTRRIPIHLCCVVLAVASFLAPSAHAGFVAPYSLGNFTLLNTNADGSANTLDGGLSVNIIGGNNGSGLEGTTDLTIAAVAAGIVHFQYSYFSTDDPFFDNTGYLLDGVYTELTDTSGVSGSVDFAVAAGQIFGFRVYTFDNGNEPGIVTISDFNVAAGGGAPGVPEPSMLSLILIGCSVLAITRAVMKRAAPMVEVRR